MPYRKGSDSKAPSTNLAFTRAKELRADATLPERLLWSRLRAHRTGFHMRRQHALGPFIADFYCDAAALVIEIDGYSHTGQYEYDESRTRWLRARGIEVVRFQAKDLLSNLDGVASTIERILQERASAKTEKAPSGLEDSATSPAQSGGGGVGGGGARPGPGTSCGPRPPGPSRG